MKYILTEDEYRNLMKNGEVAAFQTISELEKEIKDLNDRIKQYQSYDQKIKGIRQLLAEISEAMRTMMITHMYNDRFVTLLNRAQEESEKL